MLPPNNIVSGSLSISSTFSIIIWLNTLDRQNYYITYRIQASNYFYLHRNYIAKNLGAKIKRGSYESTLTTGTRSFVTRKWNLIGFLNQGATSSFYFNGLLDFTITQNSPYSETGSYLHYIGYTSSSFEGFVWSYFIFDEIITLTDYYSSSHTVGNCYVRNCPASCSPAIFDEGTSYCISESDDISVSGTGSSCGSCPDGCTSSACFDCDFCSSSKSCKMTNNVQYCICNNGVVSGSGTCTCSSGRYFTLSVVGCAECYGECSTCSEALKCLTCKDSHSTKHSKIGCTCNSGYYNSTALVNGGVCLQCYGECSTCSNQFTCDTCLKTNSIKHATIGCTCSSGYYNATALVSGGTCLTCYGECITCSTQYTCDTCVKAYSVKHVTIGCICDSGYYNTTALISGGACSQCYGECSTCSQALKCLTCKDLHASKHGTIGCTCDSGYYNTTGLIAGGSCSQCYGECLTCSEASKCLTCKDSNSFINITIGCTCKIGYYNTTALVSGGVCLQCYGECSTCSSQFACDTCLKPNSIKHATIGCTCNQGYYNATALFNGGTCIMCYGECLSCSSQSTCDSCIKDHSTKHALIGCTCDEGYYNQTALINGGTCLQCYGECSTCSEASKCLTCKKSHSTKHGAIGCICNDGYFNTSALIDGGTCQACYNECKTCSISSICKTCIADNSIPESNKGCYCIAGFYNTSSLTAQYSCLPCNSQCFNCTKENQCSTCKDSNAYPHLNIGCECDIGYYNITSLNLDGACLKCSEECESCTDPFICLTCKAENSIPHITEGCVCEDKYYNTSELTNENSCIPCYIECKTCSTGLKCDECIDSNSSPSNASGCECNEGFYNSSQILADEICKKCNIECKTCTEESKCTVCKDPQAYVSTSGDCVCNDGHFKDLNFSCQPCFMDCITCSDYFKCFQCADTFAVLNEIGCSCPKGYFNSSETQLLGCSKCGDYCLACESYEKCWECEFEKMNLNAGICECPINARLINGICIAKDGFFIQGNNSSGYYVEECHPSCRTCTDGGEGYCVLCANNLLMVNEICDSCKSGQYLDSYNCYDCPDNCLICKNDHYCVKCSSGYKNVENKCLEILFQAYLTVSKNNLIYISFTELVSASFKTDNFTFIIENRTDFKVNLIKSNLNKKLLFSLSFEKSVKAGTKVEVNLLSHDLQSVSGAYLENYNLSGELFEFKILDTNTILDSSITAIIESVKVGVSSTLCSSIVGDPAASWTLINTVQLLGFLPLNSSPLTPNLVKFLKGIAKFNIIPIFYENYYPSNTSGSPYLEARRYDISTSVFFLNIGPILVFFLAVTSLWPFAFFLSKCASGKFASKLIKLLGNYKFGFFLRFWTQMYLDIGVYAVIQLRASAYHWLGYLNQGISIMCVIGVALTPFITVVTGYFSFDKIKESDREFLKKWGSMYVEFKNNRGFWSSQYYFLYFSRRLAYFLAQVYLNEHFYVQGSIHIFCSLILIGFLLIYRPFKSCSILASNIISEVGIFIVITLSYGFNLNISDKMKEIIEIIIMLTILSVIFLQLVISMLVFVNSLKIIWIKYLEKRNLEIAKSASENISGSFDK